MKRHKAKKLGLIAIGIGIFIILTMIMPPGFWLVLLGLILIVIGIIICRK